MNEEIPSPEGDEFAWRFGNCNDYEGVFVNGDGNLAFIMNDGLKIENFSRIFSEKKSRI